MGGFSDLGVSMSDGPVDGNVLRQLTSTLLSRQAERGSMNDQRDPEREQEIREIERKNNMDHTAMMLERMKAERQAMEEAMEDNRFNYQVKLDDSLLYKYDVTNDIHEQGGAMSLDSALGKSGKRD
jgi:hypothetical protein